MPVAEAWGGYGDPLFELNWKNTSYDGDAWVYSSHFDAPAPSLGEDAAGQFTADGAVKEEVLLVLDSVKMAASVSLNVRTYPPLPSAHCGTAYSHRYYDQFLAQGWF